MTPDSLLDRLPHLGDRIDRARSIFLGLDFDGTLAPICSRPEDVVLPDAVREALRRLAGRPNVTVMIVSGRGLTDLIARVGLPELLYAGNHGMEILGPGIQFLEPTACSLAEPLREHTSSLRDRLRGIPGALVEPKGLTTTVHDRNVAPELRAHVEQIVREVVGGDPDRFVATPGRRVWEIRPRVAWHKGRAIEWVLHRLDTPAPRLEFYIGDDRTDEDAFASLPDGVTVKVGETRETLARYTIADPEGVGRFLGWLVERLSGPTRRP
ncbi:MAG: trehalose-phosphatase [Isosphaeraceae bacterium]